METPDVIFTCAGRKLMTRNLTYKDLSRELRYLGMRIDSYKTRQDAIAALKNMNEYVATYSADFSSIMHDDKMRKLRFVRK